MSMFDKIKNKFNELFPDESDPKPKAKSWLPDPVKVIMEDGKIEEYSGLFVITDGVNCMECGGRYFHTVMACEDIQEASRSGKPIRALTTKQAYLNRHMMYCPRCEELQKEEEE